MDGTDRKTAIRDYKERKTAPGIYAVRCAASGECWVGRAPDLATIQNRVWFTLRQGLHRHATLQAAWRTHGADAFSFEVVEAIEDEPLAYVRDKALRERLAYWQEKLGAAVLLA